MTRPSGGKTEPTLGNDPFAAFAVDTPTQPARVKSPRAIKPSPVKKPPAAVAVSSDVAPRHPETPAADPVDAKVDPFGFDAAYARRLHPSFDLLFDLYFRCSVVGENHIPLRSGALLVANHGGTLPYDGAMVMTAIRRATNGHRIVRPLGDDFVFRQLPIANWLSRLGVVRATPENAHRLLTTGEMALVFPEGTRGLGKFFSERYRLQRFGRGGFIKVALRAGVPIIPVAIVGSEETHPLLGQIPWLAKILGLPYFPVTPTFPWLGPLGLLPLPTKFTIRFGEPIVFDTAANRVEHNADQLATLTEIVRSRVQAMVDEGLAARRSVFLG